MLKLFDITKKYTMANDVIWALDHVSLNFRRNEFVAILGPSGCGKTTMLNILGGLDRYTDGDLVINGTSTKQYKDRDWDTYRNHSIGFVFQSYNLIPHQTILANVELALTIAGISKAERVERAKEALDKVGLGGQYYKKPNQLSGGQMQRVAIARALVNDPEIILADEPTGALDTKTSVQVMELLKEVASDRLVVMVTHNPELADTYATRIVKLRDGKVIDDSMPYSDADLERDVALYNENKAQLEEKEKTENGKKSEKNKKRKSKMSLFTAIRLSFQNLLSKRARTIMVSIAGAIGIIGVSLVLSISYGVQSYINSMQNDMLSGNPIKIEQEAYDFSALTGGMSQEEKDKLIKENGYVNVDSMVQTLVNMSKTADNLQVKNTITQTYVDYVQSIPKDHIASIFYDYGLDMSHTIYTDFYKNKTEKEDKSGTGMSVNAIRTLYIEILEQTVFEKYASYITMLVNNFEQAPAQEQYILEQYDIMDGGKIATEKNEIMLVLDSDEMLTDVLLAQLGYYTQDEFLHLIYEANNDMDEEYKLHYGDESLKKNRFSYEELVGKTFTWYPNNTIFNIGTKTGFGGSVKDAIYYEPMQKSEWTNGETLTVVGILRPKKTISYGCLKSGIYYTEALANYAIEQNLNSAVVQKLKEMYPDNEEDGYTNAVESYSFPYSYLGQEFTGSGSVGDSLSLGSLTISSLTLNMLGANTLPATISIYPKDFNHKQVVLGYLDKWNDEGDITFDGKTVTEAERERVIYSDMLSIVINMINQFIEIITIALVGFTSLSLVVSTFMIAIITYVSVVERIKEIGVIRSLGGRKKDVSRLFTAESAMIGLASGLIGIGVTYLVGAIINAIVSSVSIISTIALFPIEYALIMLAISVGLTLISGVFPARSAAQKDPVIALRTE